MGRCESNKFAQLSVYLHRREHLKSHTVSSEVHIASSKNHKQKMCMKSYMDGMDLSNVIQLITRDEKTFNR